MSSLLPRRRVYHARASKPAAPKKTSKSDKKKSPAKKKSGTPFSWRSFFIKLVLWSLLLATVTFLGGYFYFASRMDERMSARTWDLPSKLYASPLELQSGVNLPPGPLEPQLEALGYLKAPRVQNPGEYRQGEQGQYFVFARPGWPGLQSVLSAPLELRTSGDQLKSLRPVRGEAQRRYVLPSVPFAEMRQQDQETRKVVTYQQLPKSLLQAVVAVEDHRFYHHLGVDPIGLTRAVTVNLMRGGRAQGGSTITQQLAKNYFLTHEKTYLRKIKEIFYALALERKYTKQEILTLYLNEIYLGQRGAVPISGMAQAAYAFFSKEIGQLKLEESALLAGLIQSPNAYAPDRHPERARARRNIVLRKMMEQGMISEADARAASEKPIALREGKYMGRTAPYFVDHVTEELLERLPDASFSAEGYAIETTIDLRAQALAERSLREHLDTLQKESKVPLQGAVVMMEPRSGRILALVGGRDYGTSQFNRATQARRQPGSVLKPLVILAALQEKKPALGPTTLLKDEPLTLTVDGTSWSPQNNDKQFHGDVTLREVLEQSLNVPTVRLAQDIGLPRVIELLKTLGIRGQLKPHPSLALGAYEVTPLEVAGAFAALANGGRYHPPYAVKRVRDREGAVLFEADPPETKLGQAAELWLVRDMMRGVVERGTGKAARSMGYKYAVSGKTGTTTAARDTWFVGFDAELVTVVWVGTDQNQATNLTGSKAALPIWVKIMKELRRGDPPPSDPMPEGLERHTLCAETLQRVGETCPVRLEEVFWRANPPTESCALHPAPTLLDRLGEGLKPRPVSDGPSPGPELGRERPVRRFLQRLFQGNRD